MYALKYVQRTFNDGKCVNEINQEMVKQIQLFLPHEKRY